MEESNISNKREQLQTAQRLFSILSKIALGLLIFSVAGGLYVYSVDKHIGNVTYFLLLLLIDIPLLFAVFKSFCKCRSLKKEIRDYAHSSESASKQNDQIECYNQYNKLKFSIPCYLIAVVYVVIAFKQDCLIPVLILILCAVLTFIKLKSLKKKVDACDISQEEKATLDAHHKKNFKIVIGFSAALLIVLLIITGAMNGKTSNSSNGNSKVCGSCDRTFTDRANTRSIARTGMCSNCAGNYEDMSQWLDDMENKD